MSPSQHWSNNWIRKYNDEKKYLFLKILAEQGPALKTHILYKIECNTIVFADILRDLMADKLIQIAPPQTHIPAARGDYDPKNVFMLTKKGKRIIEKYLELYSMINWNATKPDTKGKRGRGRGGGEEGGYRGGKRIVGND